jgi:predicted N-acyltransferase
MSKSAENTLRVEPKISAITAAEWDACANPDPATYNPFLAHAFLKALEDAGTVGGRSGWTPQHLVLEGKQDAVLGVAPAYLKTHSQGEYIFDHGWAEAYQRAGGAYFPKLQIAVPFTPVPGPAQGPMRRPMSACWRRARSNWRGATNSPRSTRPS